MRDFLLLFHLLKSYFYKGKTVFAVFLIGCVLTGFLVYLVAGGFTSYFAERNSTDYLACRYDVGFGSPQALSSLSAYEEDPFFRGKRYYEVGCRLETGDESVYPGTVFSEPYRLEYTLIDQGRLSFTREEVETAAPVAIVSPDFHVSVGEELTVEPLGSLQVVGVLSTIMPRQIYIPPTLYEAKGFPVTDITFETARVLTLREQLAMEKRLQVAPDGGDVLINGTRIAIEKVRNLSADLIGIAALFLITALLFLYLMSYISEKNRPFYALMGTLGAGKITVFYFFVLERFVVVTGSMAVAAVLHACAGKPIYRLLQFPPSQLSFGDYFLITVIAAFVSFLVSVPFAAAFLKGRYSAILKKSE